MSTFMPWPTARRAVPMAAVVLPLPGPVFTMIKPRRMSCILGIIDCTFFGRLAGFGGPRLQSPRFIFCSAWRGAAVYFSVSWYPLPPDLLESWDWGLTTTKIFELKGVICKIFPTKELAASNIIFRLIVQL